MKNPQITQLREDVRYLYKRFLNSVKQMKEFDAIKSLTRFRDAMNSSFSTIVKDVFKDKKKETTPWEGNFEDL